ncbi:hypothetical protein ACN4EK_05605 [Pantanalinema rosaneae CENA516]
MSWDGGTIAGAGRVQESAFHITTVAIARFDPAIAFLRESTLCMVWNWAIQKRCSDR